MTRTFSSLANELDMCRAHEWDLSNQTLAIMTADFDAQADLVAKWHIACSTVSALCCTCVLITSMRVPSLRKFPANMLLWKTGCDLIMSMIVVGINASLLVMGKDPHLLHGAEVCSNGVLAGMTGFLLLASPGWFFALAFNLNRSLHDPFTKPQTRMGKFHLGVWSTSLVVGIAVAFLHEFRPNIHLCWSCHGAPEIFNWLLLFGWIACYWLFAAYFMADAYYWLMHSRRVTERISSRSSQLRASILYVAIIGVQWALAAISFSLVFNRSDEYGVNRFSPSRFSYRVLFAVVLGLLGVTDAAAWLATSLPALKEMALQRKLGRLIHAAESNADSEADGAAVGTSRKKKAAPVWYGRHRLTRAKDRAREKKNRTKETAELGDVSEALRREFVQHAIAGVIQSLKRTTGGSSRRAEELLASRVSAEDRAVNRKAASVPKPAPAPRRGEQAGEPEEIEMRQIEMLRSSDPPPAHSKTGDRSSTGSSKSRGRHTSFVSVERASGGAHAATAHGASGVAAETFDLPSEGQLPSSAFTDEPQMELGQHGSKNYFCDLAPRAFQLLREQVFQLSDDGYMEGLMGERAAGGLSTRHVLDQMVLSFSEGKGGGFFFWSIDRRFMVKTLEPEEYAKLKSLLPRYYRHMWMRRRSLLPRFYGAYSITIQSHEKHFVVMESVFRSAPDLKVHQVYDLKGSWIDRHAGIGVAQSGGTLKDMDMIAPLKLAREDAQSVLDELRHDTELLRSANLMDYSLLLGVHNQKVPTSRLDVARTEGGHIAQQVDVAQYYMGVIDVLQEWNLKKRGERWGKILLKGRFAKEIKDGMSAIEPNAYRARFLAGIGYQLGLD